MQNNTEKIEKDIHELYELYNKLARWSKETSFYINNHEIRLQNLQNLNSRQNSVTTQIIPYASYTPESSPRNSPRKIVSFRGGKSRKKRSKKRKTRNRKKIK